MKSRIEKLQKKKETQSWFFEEKKKINEIDKPLATLTKKKRKRLKLLESEVKRDTTNYTEIEDYTVIL